MTRIDGYDKSNNERMFHMVKMDKDETDGEFLQRAIKRGRSIMYEYKISSMVLKSEALKTEVTIA